MKEHVNYGPNQIETGLSTIENFMVKAARSRFARGSAVILGFGSTIAAADFLIQTPASAEVSIVDNTTPAETPTPLPVIATAQAKAIEGGIKANLTRTAVASQTAEAAANIAATAQANATQTAANIEATAIISQARQDYPEWAKEQDDLAAKKKAKEQEDAIFLVFGATAVGFTIMIPPLLYQISKINK